MHSILSQASVYMKYKQKYFLWKSKIRLLTPSRAKIGFKKKETVQVWEIKTDHKPVFQLVSSQSLKIQLSTADI